MCAWDGCPLSAEGGENEQQKALGQEKLETHSHRMCDRNPTTLLADEETETQRGAANREGTSSVRPNAANFFFLVERSYLRKGMKNSSAKCPWLLQHHPTKGERDGEQSHIKRGSGLNLLWLKYLTFEGFAKARDT